MDRMFKEQTHAATGARRWVTSIDGGETWTPGAPRDFSEAAQHLETVDTAADWWPEIAPDMPRYLHGWKTEINQRYANEPAAARAEYFATLQAYLLKNQAMLLPGARRRLPPNLLFELIEEPQIAITHAELEAKYYPLDAQADEAAAKLDAQDDAAEAARGKPLRPGWFAAFRPNRLQKGVNQTQEDGRRTAELAIGISAKDGRRLTWDEYERRNEARAFGDSPAMMKGARAAFAERDEWEDQQAELDQPITVAEQAAADEHGRNVELVMLKTQVRQDEHARRTAAAEAQRISDVRDVYATMEQQRQERARVQAARDARAAELRAARAKRRALAAALHGHSSS
jgi:hypothetical protein